MIIRKTYHSEFMATHKPFIDNPNEKHGCRQLGEVCQLSKDVLTVVWVSDKFVERNYIDKAEQKQGQKKAKGIYNTVMFFIERWDQIKAFCQAVMNSIKAVATGNIDGAKGWIEDSLGKAIPVTLGFLARLIGLGGIAEKIRKVIKKIRKPIDKAINKVVGGVAKRLKKMANKILGKDKKETDKKLSEESKQEGKNDTASKSNWWKKKKPFKTKSGESHTILFKGGEKSAQLMVASDPTPAFEFLKQAKQEQENRPTVQKAGHVASKIIAITKKLYTEKDEKQKLVNDQDNSIKDFAAILEQLSASTGTEVKAIIQRVRRDDFIPFKKGWTKERVLAIEKGQRPKPEEYLDMDYINWHLAKFASGASYLVPKDILDRWGRNILGWPDNSQFVSSATEMDAMLKKTDNDIAKIEKEMGIPAGSWQGRKLVRIDVPSLKDLNLRMSEGNEMGANEEWIPGGKLPTGQSEAVINNIKKGEYEENEIGKKGDSNLEVEWKKREPKIHPKAKDVVKKSVDKVIKNEEKKKANKRIKKWNGLRSKIDNTPDTDKLVKDPLENKLSYGKHTRGQFWKIGNEQLAEKDEPERNDIIKKKIEDVNNNTSKRAHVSLREQIFDRDKESEANERIKSALTSDSDHTKFKPIIKDGYPKEDDPSKGKSTVKYTYEGGDQVFTSIYDSETKIPEEITGEKLELHQFGRGVTQGETHEMHDRAHLIANMLMGSGYKTAKNLVVTSSTYNQVDMKKAEERLYKRLSKVQGLVSFKLNVNVEFAEPDNDVTIDELREAFNDRLDVLSSKEGTKIDKEKGTLKALLKLSDDDLSKKIASNIAKKNQARCMEVEYEVIEMEVHNSSTSQTKINDNPGIVDSVGPDYLYGVD